MAQMCPGIVGLLNIALLSVKGTYCPEQLRFYRNCVTELLKCFSVLFQDYFDEYYSLGSTGELKDALKLSWFLRPSSGIVSAYIEHRALLATRPRSIAARSINSVEFSTVSCHAGLWHRENRTSLCSLFTSGFVSPVFARLQLTP